MFQPKHLILLLLRSIFTIPYFASSNNLKTHNMKTKAPQTKKQLITALKRMTQKSISDYFSVTFDANKRHVYYFEAMNLLAAKIKEVNNL